MSAAPIPLLVVEDNEDARTILNAILKQRGFDVLMAPDARSGVAVGLYNDFDLLLCDIGLPDGDGLTVLREIRQRKDPVPVLVLTARGGLHDRVNGLRSGADGADLVVTVQNLIDARQPDDGVHD